MDAPQKPESGAAVRIFPPGVPLVCVLAGVGLGWLWPIDPGFAPPAVLRYVLGGLIIVGALLGLGLWSVVLFRRSGESEIPWKPTHAMVLRGPYRFTRNPMYLQMVLGCVGFAVLLWNAWILILTPLCAWALQRFAIRPEEAYLEAKFGEPYRDYKRRVRRWI
jgi:protein-S-isoprenylcysteine O-methyltransferase Ste14